MKKKVFVFIAKEANSNFHRGLAGNVSEGGQPYSCFSSFDRDRSTRNNAFPLNSPVKRHCVNSIAHGRRSLGSV